MNSDAPLTFADRLKLASDAMGGLTNVSRMCGIPRRTLDNYRVGGSEPRVTDIPKIAQALGVYIEWLVSGEGPMRPDDAAPAAPQEADTGLSAASPSASAWGQPPEKYTLLGRITEEIMNIYREFGIKSTMREIVTIAGAHHDRIVAETDDPYERMLKAGELFANLRHELAATASRSAQTKRSA